MTACRRLAISRLARSAAYSTVLLRHSEVSGVLRYLGPSSSGSSLRAPNAMTSPDRSRMGHISRSRNLSRGPRVPSRDRPAALSSPSAQPVPPRAQARRYQLAVGDPASAQVPGQVLPGFRRVSDAEPLGVLVFETALG